MAKRIRHKGLGSEVDNPVRGDVAASFPYRFGVAQINGEASLHRNAGVSVVRHEAIQLCVG